MAPQDALAKQATVQQDLETKVSALAAQCAALKGEKESHLNSKSKLALNLDTAGSRIVQLEQELRDAEALRRKLHNQVQELKVCRSKIIPEYALMTFRKGQHTRLLPRAASVM